MVQEPVPELRELAETLVLDSLLDQLRQRYGGYRLLEHWSQGEFHHDLVLELGAKAEPLPGRVLVVATNCNGGVKEVLCFDQAPTRLALWKARCPDSPEFTGELPTLLGGERTAHWFDPCELLSTDARSELRPEWRERQPGGGWMRRSDVSAECLSRR
jgi:hypothetical protein